MILNVQSITLDNVKHPLLLKNIPDECPICHRNILAKNVANYLLNHRDLAHCIFQCTSQKCEECFIATYNVIKNVSPYQCILHSVSPIKPKKHDFPKNILEVSPSFVGIYNQSLAAEASGLTEIFGIGLRKAIEFLIKDFAVNQNPTEEKKIKESFLGNCIKDYIDDANVKECSKRATWLANDETHYVRKWVDKDIKDLKLLIKLTVNWIDNVLLTKKYIDEMK